MNSPLKHNESGQMNYTLNTFPVEFPVAVDVPSHIEQIHGFCGLFGGHADVHGDREQLVPGHQAVSVGVLQLEPLLGLVEAVCRRQNLRHVIRNKVDDSVTCPL